MSQRPSGKLTGQTVSSARPWKMGGLFWLGVLFLFWPSSSTQGFVRRGIYGRRRKPGARLIERLSKKQKTGAREEIFGRNRPWRERGRRQGRGWSGERRKRQKVYHLDFGGSSSGKDGRASGAKARDAKRGWKPRNLSPSQIRKVMGRYNKQIGMCLITHGARAVVIRLVIAGSGRLLSLSTNGGEAMESCVQKALKDVRFPAFSSKKTKGTYNLRLN